MTGTSERQSEMAGHKFNIVILCIVLCLYFKRKDGLGLCCRNGKKEKRERERKEDHYKVFCCFSGLFAFNKRH